MKYRKNVIIKPWSSFFSFRCLHSNSSRVFWWSSMPALPKMELFSERWAKKSSKRRSLIFNTNESRKMVSLSWFLPFKTNSKLTYPFYVLFFLITCLISLHFVTHTKKLDNLFFLCRFVLLVFNWKEICTLQNN